MSMEFNVEKSLLIFLPKVIFRVTFRAALFSYSKSIFPWSEVTCGGSQQGDYPSLLLCCYGKHWGKERLRAKEHRSITFSSSVTKNQSIMSKFFLKKSAISMLWRNTEWNTIILSLQLERYIFMSWILKSKLSFSPKKYIIYSLYHTHFGEILLFERMYAGLYFESFLDRLQFLKLTY